MTRKKSLPLPPKPEPITRNRPTAEWICTVGLGPASTLIDETLLGHLICGASDRTIATILRAIAKRTEQTEQKGKP